MRDPVRIMIWTLAGLLAAITVLAFGDRLSFAWRAGWVFDLLAHWPRQLFIVGLIIGGVAIWRRMRLAAGLALVSAAINAVLVLSFNDYAQPQAAPTDARPLRVVSANVHRSMAVLENLAALARDYDADVVAVYETPEELDPETLAALFPDLPGRTLPTLGFHQQRLTNRSALAARNAEAIDETVYEGSNGVVIRARIAGVAFVTTHPPSPGGPALKFDRDRQLADLDSGLDTTQPFIIAGDFNSTPWGRAYASAPGTRAGDPRFDGTFPAFAGPLGLPIDHIRFGGGLTLTDYRVGPAIGSDHLPLFATFALPEN